MTTRRTFLLGAASLAGLSAGMPSPAYSQGFPSQRVTIVVPFGAGSITDIMARIIAEDATKKWGQQVIVENRLGLPGTIGVARATPDGTTLLLTSNGHTAIGYINKNLSIDPLKDFVGISRLSTVPMYLIVHPDVPAKNLKELIDLAKARPGTLNYATPGLGSGSFIAAALFKKTTGIDIVHIPYKGAPEAMTAAMRGDAHMYFTPLNLTDELVLTGKIRAMASLTDRRMPELPNVPTFKEAGVNFDHTPWYGLLAPARVPRPVIDKINRDVVDIIKSPSVQAKLKSQFLIGITDTPDQFDRLIREDTASLADVFKDMPN
jgi:tripartite-type tricarboxylate transporter receptor subunit TctC